MVNYKRKFIKCDPQLESRIDNLMAGVFCDILSRLPLESILVCKLVCKSWYAAIKDPAFIGVHLSRSKSRLIIVPQGRKEISEATIHIRLVDVEECITRRIPIHKMPWGNIKVMSSFNGLLCIGTLDGRLDPLCLWNPITGEYMRLPSSDSNQRILSEYVATVGFDSLTRRYKVFRYYKFRRGDKESRLEILSFGQSVWRGINVQTHGWTASGALFCNGDFYLQMGRKSAKKSWDICIVALDFRRENVQAIALPENGDKPREKKPRVEMLELEGCLALLEHDRNLLKKWVLTGDKVGELYFHENCTQIYDTKIKWDRKSFFETLRTLDEESFLWWLSTWKNINGDCFVRFSPGSEPICPLFLVTCGVRARLIFLVTDSEGCKVGEIPLGVMEGWSPVIIGSCNGMLCLATTRKLDPAAVWNPMTCDYLIFPESKSVRPVLHHFLGIGFDSFIKRYKVVRVYYDSHGSHTFTFEIITLGESSWRHLDTPSGILEIGTGAAVFVDGYFSWIIISEEVQGCDGIQILSLDIVEEKFQALSLLPVVKFPLSEPEGIDLSLLYSGGFLTLTAFGQRVPGKRRRRRGYQLMHLFLEVRICRDPLWYCNAELQNVNTV
ncbi:hypothetical protein RJ639_013844 [Escallonia herrerae]|uniref:F-box domain-containing protein n=1 Tax=Escallonia herrerae TaxID=1293975 RepID=A0AA88VKG5_9ASTE|nr:hypothetical protein RJ639_013844 [Escallonia herrerae]